MKKSNILLALAIPAVLLSCSKDPELPYDLEGTKHTFAISVTKLTQYDLLLNAGNTTGDFRVKMEVPEYMGDYSSYFKEAQLLCVYTPAGGGATTSAIALEGITEFPSEQQINMATVCENLGIAAPVIGDKMQFCANIVHKDGTVIPGWTSTMGFNYRNPSFLRMSDGSAFSYCATFTAAAPLNETLFAGGNTIKCTESVGSAYEASYGAGITRMATADIPAEIYGNDFTADDIIGLIITFDWYGWGYDEQMKVYINKKDYSVIIPDQVVGKTDENFYYYSAYPYLGEFKFSNANAELDTQTSKLYVTMNAAWIIELGTLSFGSDDYIFDFSTVL